MFGICNKCGKENSHVEWCKSCDPVNLVQSGNYAVDKFLRSALQSANRYKNVVEWIPFNRLENLKIIGKGGYSTVFSATWIDGERETRGTKLKVALKRLNDSKNISDIFLNEIEFHHKYSTINLYGLTKDPDTENYMMVLKFADSGSLRHYLTSNFKDLNWRTKLFFLHKIAKELSLIHKDGRVHRDFHDGNILIHSGNFPCISDLGLAGPSNVQTKGKEVYGVLPYVAPEVLYGEPYTTAADIYSFGIIMTEISSGKPPHGKVPHDISLAVGINEGLRPKFGKGTPEIYIKLAYQCMDADSSKRPTAIECHDKLNYWCDTLRYDGSKKEMDIAIRKEFEAADKIISNLSISNSHTYSDDMYTSRLLDFKNLPEPINSSEITQLQYLSYSSDEEKSSNE